jgi:hypothetical protein
LKKERQGKEEVTLSLMSDDLDSLESALDSIVNEFNALSESLPSATTPPQQHQPQPQQTQQAQQAQPQPQRESARIATTKRLPPIPTKTSTNTPPNVATPPQSDLQKQERRRTLSGNSSARIVDDDDMAIMRASSSGESTSITLDTLPPPAAAPTSPQKQQQQWGVVATPQIRSKPIEIGLRGGATSTVTVTPVSPRSPTVWAGAAKPPSQRSGTALNVGSAAQAAAAAAASAARPTSPGATTRARFGEAQTLQPIVDSIGRGLTVRVLYFSHLVTDSSAPRCPRVAASASTALSASTLDSLATLLPCLQSGDVIEPSEHVLTFATRDSGAATSTAGGVAAATAGAVLERFLSDVKSPRAAAFKYGDELVLQVPVDASAGRMHVRVLGANDALAPHARDLGGGALTIDVHVRVSHCHVHAIDWCGRAAIVTLPLMMRCDAALAELIDALSGVRASARVTDDEYSTSSAAREPPTVANACLFVPPLGCECHAAVRLEAALAAMATAPAIGAATPPPPAYPDGRYALPSDEVYVALEALLHHQHASIVPFVGGAAHSVRVRRRAQYSVLSVYERRGEPAAPQPVDLYAPVRNILGVLGASGIADDACVLLHVRDRSAGGGEFGAHLLPLDAPLVRYHARFGDELQRGLSLQKPWRVRVVYGDGASDTIDVRSTWTVEQLTQTALATPAARADKRRVQLIGAFVPAAKSPTASEEASGAPLVADTNTNSWGRWLAPTEAVLACRPLHDTSCMMLRQREWKVKVEIIAGSGVAAAQATFVALDPFQSLASAALKVLERVAGGSNVEQHCVFVQYPVSGDRGGARVFGEWLSDVSDETRLVYQAYNRCAARYAAEREREWCDALQRLQLHHRDVLEGVVAADDSETAVVGGEVSYSAGVARPRRHVCLGAQSGGARGAGRQHVQGGAGARHRQRARPRAADGQEDWAEEYDRLCVLLHRPRRVARAGPLDARAGRRPGVGGRRRRQQQRHERGARAHAAALRAQRSAAAGAAERRRGAHAWRTRRCAASCSRARWRSRPPSPCGSQRCRCVCSLASTCRARIAPAFSPASCSPTFCRRRPTSRTSCRSTAPTAVSAR